MNEDKQNGIECFNLNYLSFNRVCETKGHQDGRYEQEEHCGKQSHH